VSRKFSGNKLGADHVDPLTTVPSLFASGTLCQAPVQSKDPDISFDPSSGNLSISSSVIALTDSAGDTSDPVLNATINFPTFQYLNQLSTGDYLFGSNNGSSITISDSTNTYMTGDIPVLDYNPATKLFTGAISNLTVADSTSDEDTYGSSLPTGIDSEWLSDMDTLFDHNLRGFDPG
jgi:hypothetical protein